MAIPILLLILLAQFNICLGINSKSVRSELANCDEKNISFELVTGYTLTPPDSMPVSKISSGQMTDCLSQCRANSSCKAINFETGLCVLLPASATEKPDLFKPSQFPVFTSYAEKICISQGLDGRSCSSSWSFERVIGYELRNYEKKKVENSSRSGCLEACLMEHEFQCRSVNFDNLTGLCSLSDIDRHAIQAIQSKPPKSPVFSPSQSPSTDYYESNCVEEPKSLCEFRQIKGKILKTVDSIHENIETPEECQTACLNSTYRCFSYNIGDSVKGKVCRTSHLESGTLTHIEEPYLEVKDSITYERVACYKVNIICKAREMIAHVQTSKLFNGKVYAKSKPNSCVNDVTNSLEFEITMPFHDLMCDVKMKDQGKFSNDIIIQHHDMVVTTKDLGLSLNCNYDLSNKSITNQQPISIDGSLDMREENNIHSQIVGSPNVTMKIVDKNGEDITSAQVGDPLKLRLYITDENSPYQIFIRDLVAVDGIDASDITLVDAMGCPTDLSIIGFVDRVEDAGKYFLEVPFEAFKFPTSDMVQFRALVSPCLTGCTPMNCKAQGLDGKMQEKNSYGRRRRSVGTLSSSAASPSSSDSMSNAGEENEVVMAKIRITDAFGFREKSTNDNDALQRLLEEGLSSSASGSSPSSHFPREDLFDMSSSHHQFNTGQCLNMASVTIACVVFLFIQIVMIVIWALCWSRKSRKPIHGEKASFVPFTGVYQGDASSMATSPPSVASGNTMRFSPIFMPCRRD
ncbi:uncharacterized protein LOC141857583 [Brevipalpus obovatus]|uniref:uncharacterized protein LOC141857583 n=1 Tax=Brevipalpus obovatus TaxID=246614 RepID=UPI003D9F4ACC